MPWKTPSELTDGDVRGAITYLILRQQELEVALAQTLMVLLSNEDEIATPTDEEYRSTIQCLHEFLQEAYERMERMGKAVESAQAEVHSRN